MAFDDSTHECSIAQGIDIKGCIADRSAVPRCALGFLRGKRMLSAPETLLKCSYMEDFKGRRDRDIQAINSGGTAHNRKPEAAENANLRDQDSCTPL